ncbi:unnamed protein product, partial [Prorocentrum cordatum]
ADSEIVTVLRDQLARCGPQQLAPQPAVSWAFLSGFVSGICLCASIFLRSLRVGQRLLISCDVDPDLYHERLILQNVPGELPCSYLVATPEGDLYEEDLLDSGGEVFLLGPRGGFSGRLPAAATLYRFEAEYLDDNKARFIQEGREELARLQGVAGFVPVGRAAPPGDGPPVRWVAFETRFGKRVGEDVSELPGQRFLYGGRGIITISESQYMAIAWADSFTNGTVADGGDQDVRTLTVRMDSAGRREAVFPDVCKQLDSATISDWRVAGPRTIARLCRALAETGTTPTQQNYWWRSTIGLSMSDNGVDEHLFLSELLEWALCHDFLGFGSFFIGEHISRRYQLWEEVYSHALLEREAGASAAEGVDERRIFLGARRKRRKERRLAAGSGDQADEGGGENIGAAAKAKGRNGARITAVLIFKSGIFCLFLVVGLSTTFSLATRSPLRSAKCVVLVTGVLRKFGFEMVSLLLVNS